MADFSRSMSQSNPMFGRCIYRSNQRDMAEHGYITPLQAIIINQFDKKTNELLNTSEDEVAKLNYFVYDLIDALHDLDKRIMKDSKGKRHAFMFVTVNGNKYLQKLFYNEYFNRIIREEEIGVYMTSSPTNFKDPTGNKDYDGGAYIKKATSNEWSTVHPKINDFIDIINGKAVGTFPELNLSKDEIHGHMNLLINIDQCNTGVNLPGMNGVYIGRYFDRNNPLVIQIPGRVCRPDSEDIPLLGDENTAAYSKDCKYVKPFAYLYLPAGLFAEEEFIDLKETLQLTYFQNALERVIMIDTPHGLGETDEPNNEDKNKSAELDLFKTVDRPNWQTIAEKLDLLRDVKYGDIQHIKCNVIDVCKQFSAEELTVFVPVLEMLHNHNTSRYLVMDVLKKCEANLAMQK